MILKKRTLTAVAAMTSGLAGADVSLKIMMMDVTLHTHTHVSLVIQGHTVLLLCVNTATFGCWIILPCFPLCIIDLSS